MNKKPKERNAQGQMARLCLSIVCAACLLVLAACILPWHLPYDRLDHLYGIGEDSVIPVGHPGGEFAVYCQSIPGSPRLELLIDGEYYTDVECTAPGEYRVNLGAELFAKPREMEIVLRETFALPISLRSNMVRLYVM